MKIKAIAYDKVGYATESNSVDGYSFDRSFSTQRYWSSKVAQDVNHPKEAVSWFRVSQRPEVQTVIFSLSEPIENLEKASKAFA